MKKIISSVLIFSLVLTIFASATPNSRDNSVKMSNAQMMQAVGGINWYCVAAVVGTGIMIAGIFSNPLSAAAVGLYTANAILGPTISGASIVGSCGGGGSIDKGSDMRTQYHFQRVN